MNIAGIYIRVSTQEQAQEGYSIHEQEERTKKYCSAMGWKVYKVYADPGFSGGSINRPALQQLIRDVKDHRINKVVVYKLDRLSRSQRDTLNLIEDVFNSNQVDFVSMSENFDTSSPFGRATIGILAVFAQLEREQIKERMIMGKIARAKTGKWSGSYHVPIGYDYQDGKLITNEYEKIQVITAFDELISGSSIKQIVRDLSDAGYKHKHGPWNERTLRRILNSKTYLGYIYYNGEYYKSDHEAIIPEDVYNKAQKILQERSERFTKNLRPGKASSYLSGLLVCKKCGAKYSRINGEKYSYYYCASRHKRSPHLIKDPDCKNKNWRMDVLDNIIFDQIKQLAMDPDYKSESHHEENKTNILEHEITKIDNQISRLIDLYTLDQIPTDQLQSKIENLTEQKNKLQDQLFSIPERMSRSEAVTASLSFSNIINNGNFEEIREVLFTLIDKIELNDEDINIFWKFELTI